MSREVPHTGPQVIDLGPVKLVPLALVAAEWRLSLDAIRSLVAHLEEKSGRKVPVFEEEGVQVINLHAFLAAVHAYTDPSTPYSCLPDIARMWGGLTRGVIRAELGFIGRSLFGAEDQYTLGRRMRPYRGKLARYNLPKEKRPSNRKPPKQWWGKKPGDLSGRFVGDPKTPRSTGPENS